jgi:Fe-S cluster assembly protein SufD
MIATESILIEEFKKHFIDNKTGVLPREKRQEAWEVFEKAGLPTRKTEEYKFIPVTRLLEKNFNASLKPDITSSDISEESIKKHYIEGAEGYRLVIVNGKLISQLSDFPETIRLENINEVSSPQIRAHIGKYSQPQDDPFIALNSALANSGIVFCIPKNTIMDKPVYVYNITDSSLGQVHHQTRNLVIMEENSQAKVIMVNKGHGENTAFINEVNEVVMQQNAHLEWMRLEDEPEKCYHINNTRIHQEKDAHFHAISISIAGGLIRNNLNVALDGEGCQANLYGLYMTGDSNIIDNHTVVDHMKPNANSNELYKGILFDRAKGVFNGKIYVRPDAQNTNAFQSNKNILLSTDATVNTKPQLEIWADDVKCSHGCTTGQLNEEAVFYLQSRGISKEMAKALILQAFAGEVLEQIKLPEVKAYMEAYVSNKLGV